MMRQCAFDNNIGVVPRCKFRNEVSTSPALRTVHQVHGTVAMQIGLRNCEPGDTRHMQQIRQTDQGIASAESVWSSKRRGGKLQKLGFIHGAEMWKNQRIAFGILADAEFGVLIFQPEFSKGGLIGHNVAKGDAIVVGARLDHELARDTAIVAQFYAHGVVVIAYAADFTGDEFVAVVNAGGGCVHDANRASERTLTL